MTRSNTEQEGIANSSGLLDVLEEIDQASASSARVLISGDAGIGSSVIARHIHEQSARRLGPFVAMTCAGTPNDGLGRLLFDTSLERAHGGTLFIDQICELDSSLQHELLAFLQSGEFRRHAERGVQRRADVRIIAASSRSLHHEVIAGRFNETLFYRLNVIHIVVPEHQRRHGNVNFSDTRVNLNP
jgi:two-component system repressor protein LuxO